jgi:hypothetical protein
MNDEDIEKQAQAEAAELIRSSGLNHESHANTIRKLSAPAAYEHSYAEAAPGAVAGALTGYALSGAGASPTNPNFKTISTSAATPFVEKMMGVPKGDVTKLAAAQAPTRGVSLEQAKQILNGSVDPETGTTSRQRVGFNTETERQAANARKGMQNAENLAAHGIVDASGNPFYQKPVVPTQGGIFVDPVLGEKLAAEADAKATQAASRAMAAKTLAGGLSTVGKVIPFAGAGFEAMDAYNRAKHGDYSGAAISGLTGLASIPFPMLATAIGMPIQWVHDNPDKAKQMYDQSVGSAMGSLRSAFTPPSKMQSPLNAVQP